MREPERVSCQFCYIEDRPHRLGFHKVRLIVTVVRGLTLVAEAYRCGNCKEKKHTWVEYPAEVE